MSSNIILELDGIEGESVVDSHVGKIDLTDFNLGAEQIGTGHIGAGGSAGKVQVHDVSIVKKVDKASPNLFLACAKGKHIENAVITAHKAAGDDGQIGFYTIKLQHVLITSFHNQTNGSEIEEVISLKGGKIEMSYQKQNSVTGAPEGGSIDVAFDIAAIV